MKETINYNASSGESENVSKAESILDAIRRRASISFDELMDKEYRESVGKYFIDRNIKYPDPEYLIEIGGVPTMPKGNLVSVSAKWKSGKTFLCDILTAIFLGSDHFASCRSLQETGRVLFFDTEQAMTDTSRIQQIIDAMIPEERRNDYKVACLRDAPIDTDVDQSKPNSRFDVIKMSIMHEHPDLVIVDGIADLIYNYNDVIESQDMVNKLASLASQFNCCIVVVMHQNKGANDKNMKGHMGTMLYQKGSDVFNVEKHGTIFEVTHPFTRHRQCDGFCFKLDANAVPMDAIADRQLQVEMERQHNERELRDMLSGIIPEDGTPVKRSAVVDYIIANYPYKRAKAYSLLNDVIKKGWLIEVDRSTVKLKTDIDEWTNRRMDEQTNTACNEAGA